jgi:hypothetical protein
MRNLQVLMSPLGHIWGNIGKLPKLGFPPVPESCKAEKPVICEPSVEKPPVFSPLTSGEAEGKRKYQLLREMSLA